MWGQSRHILGEFRVSRRGGLFNAVFYMERYRTQEVLGPGVGELNTPLH